MMIPFRTNVPAKPKNPEYLKDLVYGAVDGAVTTFAVVSGVAGANLSPQIVVVLGLANLFADGFSMAISNYLGTKAEQQQLLKRQQEIMVEITQHPDRAREQVMQLYATKGLQGSMLEQAVQVITATPALWADALLQDAHGGGSLKTSPHKAALATFGAFLGIGALPVLPFLVNYFFSAPLSHPFWWSSVSTGVAFFGIGALKSRFVNKKWVWSGLETLLLGGAAASLAYLVGTLLKGI
ncbi:MULTISPECIES: VIT1/CCC1 transporter family protein [Rufibacter]|uniref:VIT1/CCC1 family predicted Fe2+/Mn2+ transporter n=1 Tax=Rufibacter quisquiliarum TaxID=1549639 RepID=A0A839GK63_9BACT|nr:MULTISPECIES: VIT1/CCC1 transporter family protein [Rufibacter]MBA9077179.1 VIT1/CCC1 family predicted Fe2+/Mn2+ transporter [Rufibacter quisquiliarum]